MSPLSLSLPVSVAETRVKLSSLALSLKAMPEIDARVGAVLGSASLSVGSLLSASPFGLFRSRTASSTLTSLRFSSSVGVPSTCSSKPSSSGRPLSSAVSDVSSGLSSPAASSSARDAARTSAPCDADSPGLAADSDVAPSSSIRPNARITTLSNSERVSSAFGSSAASVTVDTAASVTVAGAEPASLPLSAGSDTVSVVGASPVSAGAAG